MNDDHLYKEFGELNQFKLNTCLTSACEKGDLETVRFLLTSKKLKSNSDIRYFDYMGFISACTYGKLEVVRYLLTSTELKEHADINAQNDFAIRSTCNTKHLEIIKYLLTSPELKKHANIHASNDDAFKNAYIAENYNVLQYLILDFKIERTHEIDNFIKENPNEDIEKIFAMRNLNKSLNKELAQNEVVGKKLKL